MCLSVISPSISEQATGQCDIQRCVQKDHMIDEFARFRMGAAQGRVENNVLKRATVGPNCLTSFELPEVFGEYGRSPGVVIATFRQPFAQVRWVPSSVVEVIEVDSGGVVYGPSEFGGYSRLAAA